MMELSKRATQWTIFLFDFNQKTQRDYCITDETKWKELAPGQPFTYYFLDERFGTMYASETRLGKNFTEYFLDCHSYSMSWIVCSYLFYS
jgi:hypothetical protein